MGKAIIERTVPFFSKKNQFLSFFFLKNRERKRERKENKQVACWYWIPKGWLNKFLLGSLLYPCLINSHSKNLSNIHGCRVVMKVSDMSLHTEVSHVSSHSRSSDKGSSSISLSSSNSGLWFAVVTKDTGQSSSSAITGSSLTWIECLKNTERNQSFTKWQQTEFDQPYNEEVNWGKAQKYSVFLKNCLWLIEWAC